MRRRGLSLPEVLVAMAVMGLLSLSLMNVFGVTMTTMSHGEGHLAMQQRARETIRRLEPILSTAIPPTTTQEAIYAPTLGNTLPSVRWSSTEDLFNGAPITPRAPDFFLYELTFAGGTLTLQRVDPALADSRILGTRLQAVNFERISLYTLRVQVEVQEEVRRAAGKREMLTQRLETLIQLPYGTSD